MNSRPAEDFAAGNLNIDSAALGGADAPLAAADSATDGGGGASIPQEVVDFATYNSLHEALLQRAILREAAKDPEPMRQLEQWTHESLRSIETTCSRYDRELGARLHMRCRERAERFWNEVRAQAAQLQERPAGRD